MKVIRAEDYKSNKYIINYDVEKGVIQKNKRKNASAIEITTENFDNLVVTMADGSKPCYRNTQVNKERLQSLMWNQQEKNITEIDFLEKLTLFLKIAFGASIFAGVAIIMCFLMGIEVGGYVPVVSCLTVCEVSIPLMIRELSKDLTEIKKYDFLKENEEELNKVDLDNPNMFLNVKTKQIEEIRKKQERLESENIFDINSIDGLSLKTLKQIRENIERENYLGLTTFGEEVKESDDRQYKKV